MLDHFVAATNQLAHARDILFERIREIRVPAYTLQYIPSVHYTAGRSVTVRVLKSCETRFNTHTQ